MSQKMKTTPHTEVVTCEKYINNMLRNEKMYSARRSKTTSPAYYQDKISTIMKPSFSPNSQQPKQKLNNVRQSNPLSKAAPTLHIDSNREGNGAVKEASRSRNKSTPRCRSVSSDRESWGRILHKNKSKDRVSSFSNFNPLRTIHFLADELYTKLQTIVPDDDSVIQMITDIQQALQRIHSEEKFCVVKAAVSNKHCQTPPTLYQEDTEKFQKIMEENTYKLEISCKQLEEVCTNLQKEKEMTEKELDEARDNIELLRKKIRDLEHDMSEKTSVKIRQLEIEKENLQRELHKALQEMKDNTNIINLKKHVEELLIQKSNSEQNCTRLEYDITLLKMEKEKLITMLSVRDREIKEVQEEMYKIQEQVNNQLKKLNVEMLPRIASLRSLSDPACSVKENGVFQEIGDSTISTINTNGSENTSALQELPCGDAKNPTHKHDNLTERLTKIKSNNVETCESKVSPSFEELLKELSPSCRALITSSNF